MTRRLFTFGCSFTEYAWPTWADLLGVEFDEFQNWGYRGIGNRGIAERIAEAHARHQFNKNDTVIVQWSTHLRHDWYNDHQQPAGRPPGWKTNGSMFSPRNQHVHTKEWIELFFNESAYIMHSLNSIVLSQNLLEATGATWLMTSIGHLQNLGNDIDIRKEFGESLFNNDTISKNYPHLDFYKNEIWEKYPDQWLDPLHIFAKKYLDKGWSFVDNNGNTWNETHLSTMQYNLWIKEVLLNKLPVLPDTLKKIDKITKQIENLKELSNGNMFTLAETLRTAEIDYLNWPNTPKGF